MKNSTTSFSNKNNVKKNEKGLNSSTPYNNKKGDKTQNEILGNENLFKNDIYYNMGKNLSFDTLTVENSFRTGAFVRNLDLIKIVFYFHVFTTFFKIYSEWSDLYWVISFLRIITIIFVISFSMAMLNLNKLDKSSYIRWFMQIDIVLNLIIKTKYTFCDNLYDSSNIFIGGINNNYNTKNLIDINLNSDIGKF